MVPAILVLGLVAVVCADQVPSAWRQPSITASVADRISIAKGAIDEAVSQIDTTSGQFADPGDTYGVAGELFSQMAEFDFATNQSVYQDDLLNFWPAAQTTINGLSAVNFTGSLCVVFHLAPLGRRLTCLQHWRRAVSGASALLKLTTTATQQLRACGGIRVQDLQESDFPHFCGGIVVGGDCVYYQCGGDKERVNEREELHPFADVHRHYHGGRYFLCKRPAVEPLPLLDRDDQAKDVNDHTIDALATGGYLVLSALLAESTSNSLYLNAATQSLDFMHNHLYNAQDLVLDSISANANDSCASSSLLVPSNSGLMLEGIALLYSITGNSSLQDLAGNIVSAALSTTAWQGSNGIIKPGDIFLPRGLNAVYTRGAIPSSMMSYVAAYLGVQYNALTTLSRANGSNIYGNFAGPPTVFSNGNQTNAISALIAAISAGTGTSTTGSSSSASSPSSTALTSTSNGQAHKSSNAGAIAGGVVGGLAVLAVVVALLFFLRRRRNDKKSYRDTFGDRGLDSYPASPTRPPPIFRDQSQGVTNPLIAPGSASRRGSSTFSPPLSYAADAGSVAVASSEYRDASRDFASGSSSPPPPPSTFGSDGSTSATPLSPLRSTSGKARAVADAARAANQPVSEPATSDGDIESADPQIPTHELLRMFFVVSIRSFVHFYLPPTPRQEPLPTVRLIGAITAEDRWFLIDAVVWDDLTNSVFADDAMAVETSWVALDDVDGSDLKFGDPRSERLLLSTNFRDRVERVALDEFALVFGSNLASALAATGPRDRLVIVLCGHGQEETGNVMIGGRKALGQNPSWSHRLTKQSIESLVIKANLRQDQVLIVSTASFSGLWRSSAWTLWCDVDSIPDSDDSEPYRCRSNMADWMDGLRRKIGGIQAGPVDGVECLPLRHFTQEYALRLGITPANPPPVIGSWPAPSFPVSRKATPSLPLLTSQVAELRHLSKRVCKFHFACTPTTSPVLTGAKKLVYGTAALNDEEQHSLLRDLRRWSYDCLRAETIASHLGWSTVKPTRAEEWPWPNGTTEMKEAEASGARIFTEFRYDPMVDRWSRAPGSWLAAAWAQNGKQTIAEGDWAGALAACPKEYTIAE
uniref:Glycoside hydrolase family 76 protein n=1 Tax=Mycena chlorophos TaxID=658473 RepID=A0ABQ0LJT7_MYCCL|nr:glycoside hydrolase family 76 protein [Mycena chlorophos]